MKKAAALSKDFPVPSLEDWRLAAKKSLKGRDVSVLDKKNEDGILIHTLYIPDERVYPALAPANANFLCMPRIDLPKVGDAVAQIGLDTAQGATGFVLVIKDSNPHRFGIDIKNTDDAKRLLDAMPEKAALIEAGGRAQEIAGVFLSHRVTLHPGFDPLGQAARTGVFEIIEKEFSAALDLLTRHNHKGPAFLIDARLYHNAGASDAQELGFTLASLAENMRQMTVLGMSATEALDKHSLMMATDARQFASITKLRAMRMLWARFAELIGAPPNLHMGAETSFRMLTAKDPYTNLLRNTLAAYAAIIGGGEKITILPFTSALGLPDTFARRLAMNTLNILRDESHVAEVQDAARGSAYVEELTQQLAQGAWKIFQDIERQGGMLKALAAGSAQRLILEKREQRLKTWRAEEKKLVGITAFSDPAPRDVGVLEKFPAQEKISALALTIVRDAAAFEKNAATKKEAAA